MKKKILFILLLIAPISAYAQNLYVTVRETQLRPKADFLSKGQFLRYGDMLTYISNQADWINVKTAFGKQGYVHRSSVTDRKVILKSSSGYLSGNVSQSDVVLAGKGFSQEVERQFAAQNVNLNFGAVDAMERPRVSPNDLSSFITQGKLNGGGSK